MSASTATIPDALVQRAQALTAAYPHPCGALHPLLDLLLDNGDVAPDAVAPFVAQITGLPAAAVEGILSSRWRRGTKAGQVHICTGLSCRWMGSDAVREKLFAVPDVQVVDVDCLGACAAAPVMRRAGRLYDGLTPERLDALLAGDR